MRLRREVFLELSSYQRLVSVSVEIDDPWRGGNDYIRSGREAYAAAKVPGVAGAVDSFHPVARG